MLMKNANTMSKEKKKMHVIISKTHSFLFVFSFKRRMKEQQAKATEEA